MSEEFLKQEIADIQHQLANDPTLESCCQRDLEDQLRIAQFKAQLAPQDRSQTRQKLANAIVKTAFEEDDLRQDDDDDDDDGELSMLFFFFVCMDGTTFSSSLSHAQHTQQKHCVH